MYEAWERTTSRARISLARKAFAISPLCADAYNLLASEARTTEEARDLYACGVEAGEKALGPEGFEEFGGNFWGFLETRPYMRARHGLALSLLELDDEAGAIDHFQAMLKLNPDDNQGIRYLLLATQLRRGDMAGMTSLMDVYPDDWSATWLYTRLLLAFREGNAAKPAILKLVKEARSSNEHVPSILAGTGDRLLRILDRFAVALLQRAMLELVHNAFDRRLLSRGLLGHRAILRTAASPA